MSQRPVDVRPVHGSVTPRTPARPAADKCGVRDIADKQFTAHGVHLRVAFEAKIIVALHEHLVRDRAMRVVADRAAFAECFMLVNDWPGLFAMALRTCFVEARQARLGPHTERRPMGCFENVRAVRIVTLHAVHALLQDGVMVRQPELSVHLNVTLKAGRRFPARINDQLSAASSLDVQAAGSVTRFAPAGLAARQIGNMNACVRAGRKEAREICVAIDAGLVADKGRSFDPGNRDNGALEAGTGGERQSNRRQSQHEGNRKGAPDTRRQSRPVHLCLCF